MNTNDFYKELFEKYALDEDKIRRNAIKAAKTPAWQRAVGAHWKSVAGAAAAVAVTVGAVAYTAGQTAPGTVDIVSSDTLLSASQRLQAAEQDYYNTTSEAEGVADIYVTFLEDLCYKDMSVSFSALQDSDDIDIVCLYLNNNTVIRGKEAIEAYAEENADVKNIAGAKLCAPLRYFRDINDLSKVYRAERGSDELNDDTFAPIDYDDYDPLMNANDTSATTSAAPAETTTTLPFSFVGENTSSAVSSSSAAASDTTIDTTQPPEDDEEDPEYVESDVDQQEDDDDDVHEIIESETSDTEVAETPEISTETSVSETTVSPEEFPDAPTIGLMTQIYQLNVENALETVLDGSYAAVLTKNEAYIYKLGGLVSGQATVYEISNPKASYTDENVVILTGCGENGIRNVLITLDLKAGVIYRNDADPVIGSAEIGTIHSANNGGSFLMKAVSESKTFLYELSLGENGLQFKPLSEINGAVSLAGAKNGKLWYTAANESLKYDLYSYDTLTGETKTESAFGTECKVRRSKTFESFLISTTDAETDEARTYVFDVNSGSLIAVDISGDAMIADRHGNIYVGADGKNYTVGSDGTLTETSVPVAYVSKPESEYGIVSADSEKIVVAEKNKWLH